MPPRLLAGLEQLLQPIPLALLVLCILAGLNVLRRPRLLTHFMLAYRLPDLRPGTDFPVGSTKQYIDSGLILSVDHAIIVPLAQALYDRVVRPNPRVTSDIESTRMNGAQGFLEMTIDNEATLLVGVDLVIFQPINGLLRSGILGPAFYPPWQPQPQAAFREPDTRRYVTDKVQGDRDRVFELKTTYPESVHSGSLPNIGFDMILRFAQLNRALPETYREIEQMLEQHVPAGERIGWTIEDYTKTWFTIRQVSLVPLLLRRAFQGPRMTSAP